VQVDRGAVLLSVVALTPVVRPPGVPMLNLRRSYSRPWALDVSNSALGASRVEESVCAGVPKGGRSNG
jgi:hypothetical protein